MDNKVNEIRRKIRFLRAEMLSAEDNIRKSVNRDEDCAEAAVQLMAMRVVMLGLISERNRLGGEERYSRFFESPSELICRYRPDTILTFANDAYCRYFRKTREALEQQPLPPSRCPPQDATSPEPRREQSSRPRPTPSAA